MQYVLQSFTSVCTRFCRHKIHIQLRPNRCFCVYFFDPRAHRSPAYTTTINYDLHLCSRNSLVILMLVSFSQSDTLDGKINGFVPVYIDISFYGYYESKKPKTKQGSRQRQLFTTQKNFSCKARREIFFLLASCPRKFSESPFRGTWIKFKDRVVS